MEYKYEVALSFAGEDRQYVEQVAEILKANGVRVFYDKFEQVDLWGKDLGIHFDYIYRRESKYFIPFISTHYKEKIWTNYEVRTAIARAIENKEEYILPAKLDNTELDGIRSTIGHINLKDMHPEEFAQIILKKLGSEINIPLPEKEEAKGNVYLSTYLQISEIYGVTGVSIGVTVTNTVNGHRYFNEPYFLLSKPIEGNADTFKLFNEMYNIPFPKRMEFGEQYHVNYNLKAGFLAQMKNLSKQEVTLSAIVTTTTGEKFISNPMLIDDLFKYEK